jgi:23S rRNA pseudouridine2605 synthase
VGLDRKVRPEDLNKIFEGVELDGEKIQVDAIDYVDGSDGSEVGIEIHSGQNRVVRRIFESLGYKVIKLDRVYFAGLTKKNLPRGKWRFLTEKEVNMLKMNRFY